MIVLLSYCCLQVSKEKEIADGEEKKVAKINEEVSKKQQDCERDLGQS